jgi:endo-1,4-beta-D-glucanase Y
MKMYAWLVVIGLVAGCNQNLGAPEPSTGARLEPLAETFGPTLLKNGGFDDSTNNWNTFFLGGAAGSGSASTKQYCLNITNKGTASWNIQVTQAASVVQGKTYRLSFTAYANQTVKLRASVEKNHDDFGPLGSPAVDFALTGTATRYRTEVVINQGDTNARVNLSTGGSYIGATPATVCLDNVYLGEYSNSGTPPSGGSYPYGGSLAPSKAEGDRVVADLYAKWKTTNLVFAPDRGLRTGEITLKSPGGQFNNGMVSEGLGYGLLLSVYNNDRATFDGIWKFTKRNLNQYGMIPWLFNTNSQVLDANNATDGDMDAAFALIVAFKKGWGYEQDARNLVNAMLTHLINPGDLALERGQANNPKNIIITDYFPPGYFKVFAEFTGDNKWIQARDANYTMLKKGLDKPDVVLSPQVTDTEGNISTGNGSPDYNSDAARSPWRLAMDYVWFGDSRALAMLKDYNAFFESSQAGGLDNLCESYTRFGAKIGSWCGSDAGWMIGGAASAQLAENDTANRTKAWNAVTTAFTGDYYSFELMQLGTLLAAGRFYNPLQ